MRYRVYRAATGLVWLVASPFLALRSARETDGEWSERAGRIDGPEPGSVWVHCASVGEVAAAAPVVRGLTQEGRAVHISAVTRTGRAVAENATEGTTVSFAPLDFVPCVARALAGIDPGAVVLIETELWPNLLAESFARGVPVAVANARLSPRGLRRYLSGWTPLPELAPRLSAVACQSEADAERFVSLGVPEDRVAVTGNTKYDALPERTGSSERLRLKASLGFAEAAPVAVFGSVRPDEETSVAVAAAGILAGVPGSRVIVAPRHMERLGPVERALDEHGVRHARRSSLERSRAHEDAVVLDTTGELSALYSVADVAFVGGTLARYGGHNPLEPAAQGVPVLIGPHTDNCADAASDLLRSGGAVSVADGESLLRESMSFIMDEERRSKTAAAALAAVREGRGAGERALSFMREKGVLDRSS